MEQGFRRLKAWQKADDLAHAVFRAVASIPEKHRWLSVQATRSAVSVPANIAEGYSRGGLREYVRFLDIARGSLGELEYYLLFMQRSGLITQEAYAPLNQLRVEAGSLLFGLLLSLRSKLEDGSWDRKSAVREKSEDYVWSLEED